MLNNVYIVESLSPTDFYEQRLDGHAAHEILKILDVTTKYRTAFTEKLVKRAIAEAADDECHVLHFSSHGDATGIRLTNNTDISWADFVELIRPVASKDRALVMATCGSGDKQLTRALTAAGLVFGYVFGSTADTVRFSDSCLAWSILYNRLVDHGFEKPALMKKLKAINSAIVGDFVYRRWDGRKYLHYPTGN